jgi:hypothetical protein
MSDTYSGFVKLPRNLFEHPTWEVLTPEGKIVVILCFVNANWKESQVDIDREMVTLMPGDWLTSLETIRKKAGRGMSIKNIRTAIDRATSGKLLASKLAKGNKRIISINNEFLEDSENEVAKQTAKVWQRSGKGLAISKNIEEDQEGKEKSIYILVFDCWNKKFSTIKHRTITDRMKRAINGRVAEKHTADEICKAIGNYDAVVSSPEHYFTHKWPLDVFLSRSNGFPAFLDAADPMNNFRCKKEARSENRQLEQHKSLLQHNIEAAKKFIGEEV